MSKRTLDSFFAPRATSDKRVRLTTSDDDSFIPQTESEAISVEVSRHPTFPWSLPHLPSAITTALEPLVTTSGKPIANQPDLDLLYFQPFVPRPTAQALFQFLRSNLFFYRVRYNIQRFGREVAIDTPRFTTVFGLDDTSRFSKDGLSIVQANDVTTTVPPGRYRCKPRPIPECLDFLRRVTEAATNTSYNFCLVNYYADGSDSISYHSDDERFLGEDPAIASFTFGAKRDFLMKHKPVACGSKIEDSQKGKQPEPTLKLELSSGDMVLMRGKTQANWLHSIPKRKSGEADKGRINITFRRALIAGGTENYARYNIGTGEPHRWDPSSRAMVVQKPAKPGL